MIKKVSLVLLVVMIMVGVAVAESGEEIVFTMEDPQGDSLGTGSYTYPQHTSFPPELAQMLDLVKFTVSTTQDTTRFEFEFAQPPNLHQPWGGAGYNFHRMDLYIVSGKDGSSSTFRPGAGVEFRKPWQINLRIRDWMGAYLIHWQDDASDSQAGVWQDQVQGFNVFVQGKSIVAEISHQLLGPPLPHWQYYVLVGLQDAYGQDQYRDITQDGGPWTGGGGSETQFNPNVYDILASSAAAQHSQLQWDVGKLALLQPVGSGAGGSGLFKILAIAAVLLVAAGIAIFIWMHRK